MVERIRQAVAKALAAQGEGASASPRRAEDALWSALSPVDAAAAAGDEALLLNQNGLDPAWAAFDMLRMRLLRLLADNGWTRIGVTSPRKGAGKTYVSLNLALSLARRDDVRVMLVDLDLRAPGVADALRLNRDKRIRRFLDGEVRAEDHFMRLGGNLMIGFNTQPERGSSDMVMSVSARAALDDAIRRFRPTVALYDLPPLTAGGDAIDVLSHADGALLVAEAGATRAREIAESERLILEHAHLVGVLLNKAERGEAETYG